ncbi:RluA family pseudouridine synthase [Sneathiella sp. P13V-1]|uniref:RluA family pseudouridine synthase n=1 Tax=Sneathiella sp. P13V-1 TaxID=2697366 RepID=UPI00187B74E8|nr:RluA family pseudouridine synthase [Sneathiella sp. P13V-1]MBE7637947.1 RluA family pseudouridine synthase [Sneathiella sp. P13V-1]
MPSPEGTHQVEVSAEDVGERLDRFLAEKLGGLSRNRVKPLVKDGKASLAGEVITDPSRRVREGEIYEITIPEARDPDPIPQDIPLDIVFEDEHLIVVNKPARMVVHPAAGNWSGTLVNALLFHCGDSLSGIGGVKRPGIVHRIDKETSGLMVVAKTDAAHQGLATLFENHDIERTYRAIVWGRVYPLSGTIEGNIGRDPHNRKRMAIVTNGGKEAITHYEVEENFEDIACLVKCNLETGRTHQIRVHMAKEGHPLVGDPVYTRPKLSRTKSLPEARQNVIRKFPRQALHAQTLGFVHPITNKPLKFEVEFPSDMKKLLHAFRG